jgi:hypothetical protein
MLRLNFNGTPNSSLELNDLVYYVQNVSTSFAGSEFYSGDNSVDTNGDGLSTMVFLGKVAKITTSNGPSENIASTGVVSPTFIVYVDNLSMSLSGSVPSSDDYIFFAKEKELTYELKGYYAKVGFVNTSPKKAELFAVSMDVDESSK